MYFGSIRFEIFAQCPSQQSTVQACPLFWLTIQATEGEKGEHTHNRRDSSSKTKCWSPRWTLLKHKLLLGLQESDTARNLIPKEGRRELWTRSIFLAQLASPSLLRHQAFN